MWVGDEGEAGVGFWLSGAVGVFRMPWSGLECGCHMAARSEVTRSFLGVDLCKFLCMRVGWYGACCGLTIRLSPAGLVG